MTRFELSIFTPAGTVAVALDGGEVVVGRDEGCAVRVDDPSLSRRHAAVRVAAGTILVRDLGSANGTFVRERAGDAAATARMRPVSGEVAVPSGALLQFGAVLALAGASRDLGSPPVVVVDPAMRALHERLGRLAASPINVLLLGETGVGKEVVARALHARSARARGPFLGLNCAALPEALIEGELFGHEKGAFTGATHPRGGSVAGVSIANASLADAEVRRCTVTAIGALDFPESHGGVVEVVYPLAFSP